MVLTRGGGPQSPRSKAGAKWLSKIRKGQVAPKGLHLFPVKIFPNEQKLTNRKMLSKKHPLWMYFLI